SFAMGLVVGGSIPLVLVTSKVTGGCVPLLLRKIGLDPAMASGPVVTTVVDLVSFLVVLVLASLLLGRLAPAG
ncbi:MAG: magnesium transporter, partial [Planctomycetota bacterium]